MGLYNYSVHYSADKSGRTQAFDLDASYKDLSQVAAAMRGLPVAKARAVLEGAISMAKAIPYRKFNTGTGHRSELGGKKGKYPKKECKIMLRQLDNAVANAKAKGLDEKNLFVLAAVAYKQNVFPRYRRFFASSSTLGYGKQAIYANYVTARLELVVGEKDAEKSIKKRGKMPAATKMPKAQAKPAEKPAEKTAKKETAPAAKTETKAEAKTAEHKHEGHEGHTHA